MKIMRILTWNMQGLGGEIEKAAHLQMLLNRGEYDVICLQESTEVLPCFRYEFDIIIGPQRDIIGIWQMPNPHQPRRGVNHLLEYTAYYFRWGNGNRRCSLTTYVRNRDLVPCGLINDLIPGARPMLWIFHNNLLIGNIHLISHNPPLALAQFDHFRNQAGILYPRLICCIIGDYNIDALDVHERINDPNIYHVGQRTQLGGGCLDYMYSNIAPLDFDRLVDAGVYSDHAPVEYEMP